MNRCLSSGGLSLRELLSRATADSLSLAQVLKLQSVTIHTMLLKGEKDKGKTPSATSPTYSKDNFQQVLLSMDKGRVLNLASRKAGRPRRDTADCCIYGQLCGEVIWWKAAAQK
jgi:hypothetical protein